MTFGEIRAAVHDGWEFVWPPVLTLGVEAATCSFVAPTLWTRIRTVATEMPLAYSAETLREIAAPYQLTVIVPVVGVVTIILCLYLTNRVAATVGNLLPPQVTHSADLVLARTITPDVLARFWSATPNARSIHDIVLVIQARLASCGHSELSAAGKHWREASGRSHQVIGFAKLLAFSAIVFAIIQLALSGGMLTLAKAFVMVMAAAIIGTVALVAQLYAIEQEWYARIHAFETLLNLESPTVDAPDPLGEELLRRYNAARQERRWWNLRIPTFPYFRWVRDRLWRKLL